MYGEVCGVIDFLADSSPAGNSGLLKRLALPPAPEVKIDEEVWKVVMNALQTDTVIEFDYNGRWNAQTMHRKVHPYQLVMDDGKFGAFSYSSGDHYKIEFYENARQMVKDCVWAEDQVLTEDDSRDCTTIDFTSNQNFVIEEWVLAQGCFARPLEPQWLVDDWKWHIEEMLKMAGLN